VPYAEKANGPLRQKRQPLRQAILPSLVNSRFSTEKLTKPARTLTKCENWTVKEFGEWWATKDLNL
jgi:hypothetical protein